MVYAVLLLLAVQAKYDAYALADLPKHSALIPLSASKPLLIITSDAHGMDVRQMLCDIGLSEELLERPRLTDDPKNSGPLVIRKGAKEKPPKVASSDRYAILVNRLRPGESCQISFVHGVEDVDIGLIARLVRRGDDVACEIRPTFRIASGKESAFCVDRMDQFVNAIERNLRRAQADAEMLGRFEERLRQLQMDTQRAASTSDPGLRAAGMKSGAAIAPLQRKIRQAQDSQQSLFGMSKELNSIQAVRAYCDAVSPAAHVYVRLHLHGDTVPAKVK